MTNSEKHSLKVYASYGHTGETNWIVPLGFEQTQNIDQADVVVFGGGKDIDPGFYGEKVGARTDSPSNRDKKEKEDFDYVQRLRKEGKNVKIVGVCRGLQLICALSGGRLIQDVSNHCGNHFMSTFDKQKIPVNSIHHQMIYPYNLEKDKYKILGWSTNNLSSRYLNGKDKSMWLPTNFKELEVVLFKDTAALGYQLHPEMLFSRKNAEWGPTVKWCQDIFLDFYNDKL